MATRNTKPPAKVTPLWIVAAFLSIAELALTYGATQVSGSSQTFLIVFAALFPIAIAGAFFYVLYRRPFVFLSPDAFKSGTEMAAVIEAFSDAVSVRFGTLKIPVQDASDQFRGQIEDLQQKVSELRSATTRLTPSTGRSPAIVGAPVDGAPAPAQLENASGRVLWVTDKATDDAYEIAKLRDEGIDVAQVATTDDALRVLQSDTRIAAVVTKVARREGSTHRASAGIDLIRAARHARIPTPIFVYSGRKKIESAKDEVKVAGGQGATWSTVELFEMLHGALERPGK